MENNEKHLQRLKVDRSVFWNFPGGIHGGKTFTERYTFGITDFRGAYGAPEEQLIRREKEMNPRLLIGGHEDKLEEEYLLCVDIFVTKD